MSKKPLSWFNFHGWMWNESEKEAKRCVCCLSFSSCWNANQRQFRLMWNEEEKKRASEREVAKSRGNLVWQIDESSFVQSVWLTKEPRSVRGGRNGLCVKCSSCHSASHIVTPPPSGRPQSRSPPVFRLITLPLSLSVSTVTFPLLV